MTDTSPVEDMSYLQSQMHFDESIESIAADSDLEDGEKKKLLTSQLYAQGASGRPAALFSPKRNEQRNQTWISVFGNANVSNLSETPLECNEEHLLNRARTDLARRQIHVESTQKCLNVLTKKERRHKTGHHKTYKTKLSNLVENKLQEEFLRKEKALRDTEIRSKNAMGRMKRAQEQQVE